MYVVYETFIEVPLFQETSPTSKNSWLHTWVCGYSLFTHYSFDSKKRKHDFYKGVESMKTFCANLNGLKEHATKMINGEKKEILPVTSKEKISYQKRKLFHICKVEFSKQFNEDENYLSKTKRCRL